MPIFGSLLRGSGVAIVLIESVEISMAHILFHSISILIFSLKIASVAVTSDVPYPFDNWGPVLLGCSRGRLVFSAQNISTSSDTIFRDDAPCKFTHRCEAFREVRFKLDETLCVGFIAEVHPDSTFFEVDVFPF